MFVGHYAVALAAKRAAPKTSLGVLVVAAQFADLLWPIFLLFGWERVEIVQGNTAFNDLSFTHYPFTHSLAMLVLWAVAFGLVYKVATGYMRGALIVAGLVVSHWILDLVVHVPDLPLVPGGGPMLGLGLWNNVIATVVVESLLLLAGLWIYLRTSPPGPGMKTVAFWLLIAFIVVVGNMHGTPPDTKALAWGALIGWILPVWAWWADSGRKAADRA
jgi:hypothetical protein